MRPDRTPADPMRRRLVIAAFCLDGLCALAAPALLPLLSPERPPADRYIAIGEMCVQELDANGDTPGGLTGRPVDAALCR